MERFQAITSEPQSAFQLRSIMNSPIDAGSSSSTEVSEKLKKKARICQVLDILMMMSPIKLMTRSQLIYQQNENDIISFVNQNLSRMVKIWMMLIMVMVLKNTLIMTMTLLDNNI